MLLKTTSILINKKTIYYLLQSGAEQDLPYDDAMSVREKILQTKTIGREKINLIWCYQTLCLNNTDENNSSLAKLYSVSIKNIFKLIG